MDVNQAMAEIKQDLNDFAKIYCTTGAKIAADEFTKMAKVAIYMFYMDYEPEYYDRTFDMLNNSYKRYLHNNGRYYIGGVEVTSSGMKSYRRGPSENYPYGSGNPSSIVEGVWHGYRGPYRTLSGSDFEPLEYLKEITKDDNALIDSICRQAREAAANGNYRHIVVRVVG